MKNCYRYKSHIVAMLLCFFNVLQLAAQNCNPPLKQVVLYDQSGNFFVYWKPLVPPTNINFNVKVKCTNTPPCFFSINVNAGNVIQMNGGYLGVKIPALPSTSSTVSLSIFPPGCPTVYSAAFVEAMDIITDNLDIIVADCDSDECLLSVNAWKNLKNLSNYTTAECGGAGGAVAASTVRAVDAPISISLKKNALGKWQIKTLQPVPCDTCLLFNFQVTCPDGTVHFVQDEICFNYTGPPCKIAGLASENNGFLLIPNPAAQQCKLSVNLAAEGPVWISLYNSLGAKIVILENGVIAAAGQHEVLIPLERLQPGVYFVEVRAAGVMLRSKLMKF
jgi:hypothetical protein